MSRLKSFHPLLTESVIDLLFKKQIFTVANFVQEDPERLAKISGLNYRDVLLIRESLLAKFASSVKSGLDCFNEVLTQAALLSSGIKNLDRLLEGGFLTGNLYEFCGLSSSGKTQICMTMAVNLASTTNQVLYIDTKNDLSSTRMTLIAEFIKGPDSSVGTLMENIKVSHINNIYELLSLLYILKDSEYAYRFVIIDSLTVLMHQFLGDNRAQGRAILNNVANIIHTLASTKYMAFLITNLMSQWLSDNVMEGPDEEQVVTELTVHKPGLGKYWACIPDTRICVSRFTNTSDLLLTILKSSSLPVGKTTKLSVTEGGVT